MRLPAITGLSRDSIEDLVRRRIRTFEIRSAHNLIVFSQAKLEDRVFVTDAVPPDVVPGLNGYIATIRGIDIHMYRTQMSTPLNFEEREMMAGRVQLVLHAYAKVRSVPKIEPYQPIMVDVIELQHCEAR